MRSKNLWRYILLLFWCLVIFFFSHDTGESSSKKSSKVTEFVVEVYEKVTTQEVDRSDLVMQNWHHGIRKFAHFSLYFVLGICAFLCFYDTSKNFFISLSFCFFYSITDEVHQLFLSGRNASITDIFLDTFGSFCGILLLFIIFRTLYKSNLLVKKFDKSRNFC